MCVMYYNDMCVMYIIWLRPLFYGNEQLLSLILLLSYQLIIIRVVCLLSFLFISNVLLFPKCFIIVLYYSCQCAV